LEFGLFVGDVISGVGFRPLWLRLPSFGPQLLDGKFMLKTKVQSESFELLVSFLTFLVQRLQS